MFGLDVLSSLLGDNTAEARQDSCLRRFKNSQCQTCVTVCPVGAVSVERNPTIERDRCIGCGICVPSCPTGVFALPKTTRAGIAAAIATSGIHRLVCSIGQKGGVGVKVPCLGFLDVGMLLVAARQWRNTVLDARWCSGCTLGTVLPDIILRVDKANEFLEAFGQNAPIVLATQPEEHASKTSGEGCSRRDLFSFFKAESARSLVNVANSQSIPFVPSDQARQPLPAHRALVSQLARLGAELALNAPGVGVSPRPVVGSNCSFCGICAAGCPASAITVADEAKTISLVLAAARCSACGLCVDVCPEGAIEMTDRTTLGEVLARQRYILYRMDKMNCSKCGEPAEGKSDLCSRCRVEQNMSSFL